MIGCIYIPCCAENQIYGEYNCRAEFVREKRTFNGVLVEIKVFEDWQQQQMTQREGIAEICSGCFNLRMSTILEANPRKQKRAGESELRREALRPPRGRGRVRE